MSRIHAFEWNDLEAAPVWLRESIVESLGRGLRWGRIYTPIAPLFARFVERTGAKSVLDVATGSGEPCSILIDALKAQGIAPPRFVGCDLFPNVPALEIIKARHPGLFDFVPQSVDATAVPPEADQPARTIISAFHHFTPELAKRILADCVAKRRAVFIIEAFPRSLIRLPAVLWIVAITAFLNPFLARRQRLWKLLFTLIPLIPLFGLWDAVVSVLRVHSEADLRAMVAGSEETYDWEYHTIPYRLGGRANVFLGIPRATPG